jgi:DNA-binding CsgD family transcriptional regulator
VAEAVLVTEDRFQPTDVLAGAQEALAGLPADDHARRARLHGLLTHIGYYVDPASMVGHCEQAEAEAARAGDPLAELAAIRARHTVSYGPEHVRLRLELAERLGRVARAIGRPSIALWEPLWAIDALVEVGRVTEAVALLPGLRQAVAAAGAPMARWHLARVEAALAQAAGRFADALAFAHEARRLFARLEVPLGAESVYLGFRIVVEMHAGWTTELADRWAAVDLAQAPPFLGELPLTGPAAALAGLDGLDGPGDRDRDRARRAYDRLGPAEGWDPPPSLWRHMHAIRIFLAARLGVLADLPPLLAALEPHRGLHVGTGGGMIAYEGVVELWLGAGAAALGRRDDADRDLATAGDVARAAGTEGFAVHADVERAEALVGRGRPGDGELLAQARPVAERLGMPEFLDRIDAAAAAAAVDPDPLSPRELEVAALVADGRTNREIAAQLYLSERTAQNHVQHILTKLGVGNRTQAAGWYRDRHGPDPGGGLALIPGG